MTRNKPVPMPEITEFGFAGHQDDINPCPPEPSQITLCKVWLLYWADRQKSINRRGMCSQTSPYDAGYTSYSLRIAIEDAMGCYVSNGAVIQAAVDLSYKCERASWDSPNAVFNMSFLRAEDYFISRLNRGRTGLGHIFKVFNEQFPLERVAGNYLNRAKAVIGVIHARTGVVTEQDIIDLPNTLSKYMTDAPGLNTPIKQFSGPITELEMWVVETVLGLRQVVATPTEEKTTDE